MKILILESSGNRQGSSNMLASEFVRGAQEAGHETICSYMQFEDMGIILGGGCGTPDMTRASKYPQEAYRLGKSL